MLGYVLLLVGNVRPAVLGDLMLSLLLRKDHLMKLCIKTLLTVMPANFLSLLVLCALKRLQLATTHNVLVIMALAWSLMRT